VDFFAAKFQLNHFFKNTLSSVFNQFKHFLALSLLITFSFNESKNKNQKNAQIPTGIMISTKKQFHLLGEYQRQPSPSLTNQTLCVYEHFKQVFGMKIKHLTL
jgi:hypothetical protein